MLALTVVILTFLGCVDSFASLSPSLDHIPPSSQLVGDTLTITLPGFELAVLMIAETSPFRSNRFPINISTNFWFSIESDYEVDISKIRMIDSLGMFDFRACRTIQG